MNEVAPEIVQAVPPVYLEVEDLTAYEAHQRELDRASELIEQGRI